MNLMSKAKRLGAKLRYKTARGTAKLARIVRKPAVKANQKIADILSSAHANLKIRPKFSDSAASFAAKKQAYNIMKSDSKRKVAGALNRAATKTSHHVAKAAKYLLPAGAVLAVKNKLEED